MERLTEWNDEQIRHAYYPRCFEEPCYGSGCKINDCPFETAACDRLASYEDSRCEPEEVLPKDKADEIALKLMRIADLESLCNYTRLRELAEADKDGRVVVLPCKVGDTVYFVNAKHILEFTVVGYAVDETGISWVHSEHVDKTGHTNERTFSPDRIGKTTFLSREEAKKALEERGKA